MKKDWFQNIKIKNKLFLAFGTLVSMVTILAIITTVIINSVEQNYIRLLDGPQQRLTYSSDAVSELMNIRRYILSMGYYGDNKETINEYYSKCGEAIEVFLSYIDSYYENLDADRFLSASEAESRKGIVSTVKAIFTNEYIHYVEAVYQASIAGDRVLIDSLVHDGIPLGNEITGMLSALRLKVQEHAEYIMDKTLLYARTSKYIIAIFACLIAFTALMVSMLMQHVIKTPIVNMEFAMRKIAGGDLTYPIRNGYKDELGSLSEEIGDMVDRISMLNKSVNILDSIEDIIFVTDLNYNLIYYNQKAYEVFCVAGGGLPNVKCYKTAFDKKDICAECPLARLRAEKESMPSVKWERYDSRSGKWLACSNSIVRWVDGSLAQICACKDDTPRKLREEELIRHEKELRKAVEAAKEASRLKSAFLANMSHEIRTPMNGIIGFAELALDDGVSPKIGNYLENIKTSSEGLLQLINDILDISKIEAGKITLESTPFDLHDVFKACQAIIGPKAAEKGISLFCYAEPLIGRMLLGDPTRLRQVVLNLLSNAVKFTNVGIVKLLSEMEETDSDNVSIRFEVKDSGIGMTATQIERIFEPFTQADDSTTRRYGGTGLGLSISKNIVELMGGKLHVESTPGVGSKFSFSLKLPTIDKVAGHEFENYDTDELTKPVFKGTVLVCEDNVLNQQVISEHLSRVGLRCEIAANGRLCIECVQRRAKENKPFDLIFMDIHMPVMDGLEAAKKLLEIGCETPIVALTANIMPNDKEMYKTYGMPDCLAKPFMARQLWRVLLKYLEPVAAEVIDVKDASESDKRIRIKLQKNFLADNKNTYKEIGEAIKDGNIKLAHRRAHTLKGVAGLIGKTALCDAASEIERGLSGDTIEITPEGMKALEKELNAVLNELSMMFDGIEAKAKSESTVDIKSALDLLNKLEPLLKACDTDCMDMIDNLSLIPGAEELIQQMEFFDYASARKTLSGMKRGLEKDVNG